MDRKITHFIFDMDGLLLDTEPFYTEAAQKIVGEFGKKFTWELKSQTMGRPSIVSAKLIAKTLDLPISGEEYLRRREKIMTHIFPTAKPMTGAVELTNLLKSKNIPIAVATSSAKAIYALKVVNHKKWFSIFDVIINGDDPEIKSGKPSPDIFLLTAKMLNVEPENCIVFEDSPTGVLAGVAAGMTTIAVCDPKLDKGLFSKADRVYNSLNDFKLSEWI